jgi:uncharacterized protein YifN (PemK superfamily)
MINWNDIRVEQEIAQERYQVIVPERTARELRELNRSMRARQMTTNHKRGTPFHSRALSWLRCRLAAWRDRYSLSSLRGIDHHPLGQDIIPD